MLLYLVCFHLATFLLQNEEKRVGEKNDLYHDNFTHGSSEKFLSPHQCVPNADSDGSVFTDDEGLFNDLMCKEIDSKPSLSLGKSLNERDMQTLQSILHSPQGSISEPDNAIYTATPELPPPQQFASVVHTSATHTATPYWMQHERDRQAKPVDDIWSSSVSTPHKGYSSTNECHPKKIARRHSFTLQHKSSMIYQREGSTSSGSRPKAIYRGHCKHYTANKNPKHAIRVVTHDDICNPIGNCSVDTVEQQNSFAKYRSCASSPTVCTEEASVSSLNRAPSAPYCTLESSHIPFGGNPNEKLSFDEVLLSYDEYALATGTTAKTKSSRSPSNPKREKRKKDRKRSMTADIDTATVLAAKAAFYTDKPFTPERKRRVSKVQQLAREYSKRIRDHHKGKWLMDETPKEEEKLDSLVGLKRNEYTECGKRNRSPKPEDESADANVLKPRCHTSSDQEHSPLDALPHSRSIELGQNQVDTHDTVEFQRKGGLKGWVRSIVVKFGGNNI